MQSMSDTKVVINQTFYYDILLRNWNKFIQETINGLTDSGLRTDSSLFALFSRMAKKAEQSERLINNIYKKGIGGVLTEQIEPLAKNVDKYFTDKLDILKSKNASPKEIKKVQDEWDRLKDEDPIKNKLDLEELDEIIKGLLEKRNRLSNSLKGLDFNDLPF
jgi:succinate dehydrogenase/fumarate reductase flavoprotein subunit